MIIYWLCNHMLVPQIPSSFNVLVCSNKQTIWYYFLVAMNAFHPSFHDWLLSQWSWWYVCMGVVNCHSQVNFLWKLHHLHLTNTIIPTLLTHTEVFFLTWDKASASKGTLLLISIHIQNGQCVWQIEIEFYCSRHARLCLYIFLSSAEKKMYFKFI